jgi:hypothetical protein
MLVPWMDSVKKSKKLLVFNGITTAQWMPIFAPALQSFNKLPIAIEAKEEKDRDKANVLMFTSTGTAKHEHGDEEKNATFDATRFHGYTMLFHRQKILEEVAIFLPSEPKIQGGFKDNGETIWETPNLDQMRVIAVHELIHACGLDNAEHDDEGVFQKNLTPVGTKMGYVMAIKGSKLMPPIYLSGATKAKIIKNWSK